MSQSTRAGVIVERPDLAIYDTRDLPWSQFEGFGEGFVRKILARFQDGPDAGKPEAFIFYMPAGFTVPGLPYRHYHSTVEELSYTLAGELPHWEYRDADQQIGVLSRRRPGSAMHRLGGSIHGLEPYPPTQVGYTSLMVRSGTGNWIPDEGFDRETVHVDYAPGWTEPDEIVEAKVEYGTGLIVDWGDLKIWDTDFMEWEPMPSRPGALWKPLAREADGRVKMAIVNLPPRSELRPHRHAHAFTSMSLTLAGALPVCDWEQGGGEGTVTVLRQGIWVTRRPGAVHGYAEGAQIGPDGWVGLCYWIGASGEPGDTVDVA